MLLSKPHALLFSAIFIATACGEFRNNLSQNTNTKSDGGDTDSSTITPPTPQTPQTIAYLGLNPEGSTRYNLYLAKVLDGKFTEQRKVFELDTTTDDTISNFKWSEDGSLLICTRVTSGIPALYSVNLDNNPTESAYKVSAYRNRIGGLDNYYLSPDGQHLIYTEESLRDLYLISKDSTANRFVLPQNIEGLPDDYQAIDTLWRPNSSGFSINMAKDGDYKIYYVGVSAEGNSLNLVTGFPVKTYSLRWSNDSKTLIYQKEGYVSLNVSPATFAVTLTNQSPSSQIQLNPDFEDLSGTLHTYALSPKNDSLAYVADPTNSGQYDIYLSGTLTNPKLATRANIQRGNVAVGVQWIDETNLMAITTPQAGAEFELSTLDISTVPSELTAINQPLTENGNVTKFALSSSRQQVAYLADAETDQTVELYAAKTDGTQQRKLSHQLVSNQDVISFGWHPSIDGLLWYLTSDPTSLYIVEITNKVPEKIATAEITPNVFHKIRWHPTEPLLAYWQNKAGNTYRVETAYRSGTKKADSQLPNILPPYLSFFTQAAWQPEPVR